MSFVCRSCARQAAVAPPAARTFSSSAAAASNLRLPEFPPTDSPELATLLTTLQDSHIAPSFFTPEQKRLVYRTKYRSRLLNNPTTITLRGQDIDLRPLDRNALSASRAELLNKTLETMAKEDSWTHLPALLDGIASLQKTLKHTLIAKTVRLAAAAGRFGSVAQALRSEAWRAHVAKNTLLLHAVLRGPRQTAESGAWSPAALEKATRQAEDVKASLAAAGVELAAPEVVAAWLELWAVRGDRAQTQRYYERVLGCFDLGALPKVEELERDVAGGFMRVLPLWQGVVLAEKMLGVGKTDLGAFAARCGRELESAVAELKRKEIKQGSFAEVAIREFEVAKQRVRA